MLFSKCYFYTSNSGIIMGIVWNTFKQFYQYIYFLFFFGGGGEGREEKKQEVLYYCVTNYNAQIIAHTCT